MTAFLVTAAIWCSIGFVVGYVAAEVAREWRFWHAQSRRRR